MGVACLCVCDGTALSLEVHPHTSRLSRHALLLPEPTRVRLARSRPVCVSRILDRLREDRAVVVPVREELEAGLDGPVEDEEGRRARADEFRGEGDDEEHVREGRVLGSDYG